MRRRRQLLGLTQDDVAQACNIGFRQIQKYESACSRISASRLWGLAGALRAPVGYFFEPDGPCGTAPAQAEAGPSLPDVTDAFGRLSPLERRQLLDLARSMRQA